MDSLASTKSFVFGVGGLDSLLGGALVGGSLVVVAGHPGSGKTTLASTICYQNALKGHKCLYISFQEDKEKLYKNTQKLGINLQETENKKQTKHIKIPIIASEDAVTDVIIETLSREVTDFSPDVIVIDSITPVLECIGTSVKARAILQNFFANLPRLTEGLVVLVAEMPLGKDEVGSGGLEFVADTILVLRHKLAGRLLLRELEVRKSRNAPVSIAKVVFTIVEGLGIRMYVPPKLSEIPPPDLSKPFEHACKVISELMRPLRAGEVVYVTYPPSHFPHSLLLYTVATALHNHSKLLMVSYEKSSNHLWQEIAQELERVAQFNISPELLSENLKDVVVVDAYNPTAYVPEELYHLTIDTVERVKPDIVALVGFAPTSIPTNTFVKEYSDLTTNTILHFRRMKTLTMVMGLYRRRVHELLASLADIVVKNWVRRVDNVGFTEHISVEKVGPSFTIGKEGIESCVYDACKTLLRYLTSRNRQS